MLDTSDRRDLYSYSDDEITSHPHGTATAHELQKQLLIFILATTSHNYSHIT